MTKVKYLGGATSQFGYDFEDGKSVDVTDDKALAKFKGNRFFEVAGDKAEDTEKPVDATTGLKAEHHGGGKFNITNGENVIQRGLSKADADAFNAMTDDEKTAYVTGQN